MTTAASRNPSPVETFAVQVEEQLDPVLKPIEQVLEQAAGALSPEARRVLGGDWLGHPLHPMLTDLPIGFWTSSFLLDFAGRKARRTSTVMVGLGVASAVPTIAAGLAEFAKLPDEKKRTAAIHALANAVATLFYAMSFVARLRRKRLSGFALGMVGATVATAGGYLGGKLAFDHDG